MEKYIQWKQPSQLKYLKINSENTRTMSESDSKVMSHKCLHKNKATGVNFFSATCFPINSLSQKKLLLNIGWLT